MIIDFILAEDLISLFYSKVFSVLSFKNEKDCTSNSASSHSFGLYSPFFCFQPGQFFFKLISFLYYFVKLTETYATNSGFHTVFKKKKQNFKLIGTLSVFQAIMCDDFTKCFPTT